MKNSNLNSAKDAKYDEFYTLYKDIEKEVEHYKPQFENKIVYCNCDNFNISNFVKYFSDNFDKLKLKKLIATCYNKNGKGLKYELYKDCANYYELNGDGDFRNDENIEILKECDIVVTNPPFSLTREHMQQMFDYGKKFLVIGNMNIITHKNMFPHFVNAELFVGYHHIGNDMLFDVPESYKETLVREKTKNGGWKEVDGKIYGRVANACWFTNLDKLPNDTISLTKTYNDIDYPKYDNFGIINVNKVVDIPYDYEGVAGVPITVAEKLCSDGYVHFNNAKFKIVGSIGASNDYNIGKAIINGKQIYKRILLKKC